MHLVVARKAVLPIDPAGCANRSSSLRQAGPTSIHWGQLRYMATAFLDYNYSNQSRNAIRSAIFQRCDKIDICTDDLLNSGFQDQKRDLDLKFKSSKRKQAVSEWET